MYKSSIVRQLTIVVAVAGVCSNGAVAEDWASNTPGNWSDPLNWSPQSVPNGIGASATILSTVEGGPLDTSGTFIFDVPVTLGTFHADMGAGGPSLFFTGNTLTMDNGGGADVTMFTDGSLAMNFTNDIVLMGNLVTEWRSSNASITGTISGNFGITQDAVGGIPRIRLWGNNTYTGLTIARNGWISFETVAGLGDNSVGTIVESGGTLVMESLSAPIIIGEPVTIMDGGRLLTRPCEWAQEIVMVNNARIAPWFDDYEVTISGKLTGNASFTRLSAQSNSTTDPLRESIIFLTNSTNDYTGGTIIDSGLLAVSDDAQLGAAGTSITFNQVGFSEGSSGFITTADVTINRDIILLDPGWLRASDGTTGSHAGLISGNQPLQIGFHIWVGVVELLGDNTYTGDTTVRAGTLRVGNTTGSATGSGDVAVESGATLGGDGSIAGAVTAQSGATIGPDASTGALDVGSATFEAGSTFEVELAGASDFDQLLVTNTATLAGSIDVSLIGGYSPADGAVFDVIIASGFSGVFDSESLPAGFSIEYLADRVRLNFDGVACPADIADSVGPNPDGLVNVFDLLELLSNWGTNGAGSTIAAPDDVVDVFDLLELLAVWGACS